MEITINNLTKTYKKKIALDSINLKIEEGMFGLLGANGAGKTTLIRILATLLQKTSGEVIIDGIPIENVNEIRKFIGYLPQEFSFYPNFTVHDLLDYFCVLSKVEKDREKHILELLETVNLQDMYRARVKTLSGGMKRRLGIAVALINNPQFLLVDEPTVGLDPEERMRFRNLLTNYAHGRTVLLSSHIISDIEEICSNLAVLKEGRILFTGSAKLLRQITQGNVWELEVSEEQYEVLRSNFENKATIISQILNGDMIKLRILSDDKPAISAVSVESKLEDSYIKIMNNK